MTLAPGSREWVVDALPRWATRGWLRPLDLAFARFIADVAPDADGAVLLVAALVAHLEGQGHPCVDLHALRVAPGAYVGWDEDGLDALVHVTERVAPTAAALRASLIACHVVADASHARCAGGAEPLVLDGERLYLRRFWRAERRIVAQVSARAARVIAIDEARARDAIEHWFEAGERTADEAVDWQRVAAAAALRRPLAILTGGPGTGKTFTAARILALAFALGPTPPRVALAAPTGKAAARLRQAIDDALADLGRRSGEALAFGARVGAARTLHRLLGARHGSRRFRHDAANPLAIDLLIVDEASMIDVELMDAVLDALPPEARLVLLGDQDQLASVEAGAVLGELCRDAGEGRYRPDTADALQDISGERLPADVRDATASPIAECVVALRRSRRFGTAIGGLARAVRDGDAKAARAALVGRDKATKWIVAPTPDTVVDLAIGKSGYRAYIEALSNRAVSLFVEEHDAWVQDVLRAFDRFRVLCAVREGPWGVAGMNRAIEARIPGPKRPDGRNASPWYAGRPIIVTRNDADAGVFNGDVGIALPGVGGDDGLRVHFGAGAEARSVGVGRLADVETAYAMTVHKAQGSEFAHVAVVLPPETGRVVTRELLYTGITRARDAFTLATSREASLDEAIGQTTRRSSGIAAMLADASRR